MLPHQQSPGRLSQPSPIRHSTPPTHSNNSSNGNNNSNNNSRVGIPIIDPANLQPVFYSPLRNMSPQSNSIAPVRRSLNFQNGVYHDQQNNSNSNSGSSNSPSSNGPYHSSHVKYTNNSQNQSQLYSNKQMPLSKDSSYQMYPAPKEFHQSMGMSNHQSNLRVQAPHFVSRNSRWQDKKRDENEAPINAAKWSKLDLSHNALLSLAPVLFSYNHITHLFLSKNRLSFIPPEICHLTQLQQLDLAENLLRTMPQEVGYLQKLKDVNLSNNQFEQLPYQLSLCGGIEKIEISNNPLPARIKPVLEKGTSALYSLIVEEAPPLSTPPDRTWHITNEEIKANGESVVVLCYNILCPIYATSNMYKYCPSRALNWEHRKNIILREITSANADIICLQEVGTSQFHTFFTPELRAVGYDGIFHPKSRARTMSDEERKQVDGCAIFYRTSTFGILEHHTLDMNSLAISSLNPTKDMINRVASKDNVAVVCLLESRATKSQFFVSNVHVHWNPEFKDVKVIQTSILLNELENLLARSSRAYGNPPLILCGDFNSLPDSGVFELLSSGNIPYDHPDISNSDYGSFVGSGLSHSFNLASAYSGNGEDMEYTNYTYDFKGAIDWIFYSKDRFKVTGKLMDVPNNYLSTIPGLPNEHFPSDHLPLLCEITLII